MCDQTEVKYLPNDVVWVKLGSLWWPGQVYQEDEEELNRFKKPPIAVVKFFKEESFEYVKDISNIYRYNCLRKTEFIKKGLDMCRTNNRNVPNIKKFPDDVVKAEILTDGNPNIIHDDIFQPEEKPDYKEIFTASTKKSSTKKLRIASESAGRTVGGTVPIRPITHPRFLKLPKEVLPIYETKELLQFPSENAFVPSAWETSRLYKCSNCDYIAHRVNVLMLHHRTHYWPKPGKKGKGGKEKSRISLKFTGRENRPLKRKSDQNNLTSIISKRKSGGGKLATNKFEKTINKSDKNMQDDLPDELIDDWREFEDLEEEPIDEKPDSKSQELVAKKVENIFKRKEEETSGRGRKRGGVGKMDEKSTPKILKSNEMKNLDKGASSYEFTEDAPPDSPSIFGRRIPTSIKEVKKNDSVNQQSSPVAVAGAKKSTNKKEARKLTDDKIFEFDKIVSVKPTHSAKPKPGEITLSELKDLLKTPPPPDDSSDDDKTLKKNIDTIDKDIQNFSSVIENKFSDIINLKRSPLTKDPVKEAQKAEDKVEATTDGTVSVPTGPQIQIDVSEIPLPTDPCISSNNTADVSSETKSSSSETIASTMLTQNFQNDFFGAPEETKKEIPDNSDDIDLDDFLKFEKNRPPPQNVPPPKVSTALRSPSSRIVVTPRGNPSSKIILTPPSSKIGAASSPHKSAPQAPISLLPKTIISTPIRSTTTAAQIPPPKSTSGVGTNSITVVDPRTGTRKKYNVTKEQYDFILNTGRSPTKPVTGGVATPTLSKPVTGGVTTPTSVKPVTGGVATPISAKLVTGGVATPVLTVTNPIRTSSTTRPGTVIPRVGNTGNLVSMTFVPTTRNLAPRLVSTVSKTPQKILIPHSSTSSLSVVAQRAAGAGIGSPLNRNPISFKLKNVRSQLGSVGAQGPKVTTIASPPAPAKNLSRPIMNVPAGKMPIIPTGNSSRPNLFLPSPTKSTEGVGDASPVKSSVVAGGKEDILAKALLDTDVLSCNISLDDDGNVIETLVPNDDQEVTNLNQTSIMTSSAGEGGNILYENLGAQVVILSDNNE